MLRQGFMKKYRTKSKFDSDRFEKEDEGYLLKLSRPLKPYSIKALNKEKLNKSKLNKVKNIMHLWKDSIDLKNNIHINLPIFILFPSIDFSSSFKIILANITSIFFDIF